MEDFAIRYDGWSGWFVRVLGLGPRWSRVTVVDDRVLVRMGYGFRAAIDRAAIESISRWSGRLWSRGVHGWRQKWLVNGSSQGIVVLTIDPPARALVLGVPVRVRELVISLDDPDALAAAIGLPLSPTPAPGFQLRW